MTDWPGEKRRFSTLLYRCPSGHDTTQKEEEEGSPEEKEGRGGGKKGELGAGKFASSREDAPLILPPLSPFVMPGLSRGKRKGGKGLRHGEEEVVARIWRFFHPSPITRGIFMLHVRGDEKVFEGREREEGLREGPLGDPGVY